MTHDGVDPKIAKYVAMKYATESNRIAKESQEALKRMTHEVASRGALLTGATIGAIIANTADTIKAYVNARAQALMEGYELYGAPLPDSILDELREMIELKVAAGANGLANNAQIAAFNSNVPIEKRMQEIRQRLESLTSGLLTSIACELERRRVVPQTRRDSGTVTNNMFYQYGHGSKLNIGSTDNSITTVVVNQQQLFAQLRDVIQKSDEPARAEIVKRLDELEKADKRTVSERFKDFMDMSASAITVIKEIGPYLPALTDWMHKVLVG